VDDVYFEVAISATIKHPPKGYLFLCPEDHFQTGPSSFCWPDCPAYWSLDSSGVERLNTDNATELGFPSFQLNTTIKGNYWDASAYAALRQFYQDKGFHPDSLDVARYLGHRLFQLSGERDAPFPSGKSCIAEQLSCSANQYFSG
jgi:hypothetical protein